MTFVVLSAVLIAWGTLHTHGPRIGLWRGWVVALLLVPSWIAMRLGALTVDLRSVAAFAGLVALWLHRGDGRRRHWQFADIVITLLVLMQIASEYHAGQPGLFTAPEIARAWLLPYLVGRWFLASGQDVRAVLPVFAPTILALCVCALAEAVMQVNPVNEFLGKVYPLLEEGQGYRWGLKRAQAFFDHPIHLGYLLVLILPWVMEAAKQSARGGGPGWWKLLPIAVFGALACTASRGPIIAGVLTVCAPTVLARPRWWVPALGVAVVVAATLILFQDAIVDVLARWAGEKADEPVTLMIRGEEVEYTGTNHRLLLFRVYEDALARLGPLGYGSQLREVDMDGVPTRFQSVDSHYVLFLLQRGYLGLGLFLLLALVTIINLVRVARDPRSPVAGIAAGLLGAMVTVTAMLFTVWFAPDFGSAWIFVVGLAANLRSLRDPNERSGLLAAETGVTSVYVARPRLLPGHAPVRQSLKR